MQSIRIGWGGGPRDSKNSLSLESPFPFLNLTLRFRDLALGCGLRLNNIAPFFYVNPVKVKEFYF